MTENISILGSTGSIGTQALEVCRALGIRVSALTANSSVDILEKQIREFKPEIAVLTEKSAANELKGRISDLGTKVLCGMEGLCEAAAAKQADTVLTSVVGMVGLTPTLEAINAGKNIALANKETLVTGGSLVMKRAKEKNVKIYPVDSEHSAVFQCLQGCPDKKMLNRLILTASGGPFYGYSSEQLKSVTVEQALNHPNWSMGNKITIDSATMMNKGLEIIEAKWLFDMPIEKIDVVIHRESVVHSMIEYTDNSVIAQMGVPDMKIPIQYALTYPQRMSCPVEKLDLTKVGTLSFMKPDYDTFKCLNACKRSMELGGTAPVLANGANEAAVKLFLDRKISFTDIGDIVWGAITDLPIEDIFDVDSIIKADKAAREYAVSYSR